MANPALKRNLVAMNEQKLVTHVIGAYPTLIGDGADIAGWRTNGQFSAPYAVVFIEFDTIGAILSAPAGGIAVDLLGYRTGLGWCRIGFLNDASQIITGPDGQGYAQQCDVLGVFERLYVAGACSAGQAIAKFCPLEYYT